MASKPGASAQPNRPPKPSGLRVSQIIVNLVLLDEHDSPVRPDALIFQGDETGSAAEHLAAWLGELPMQLVMANATIPQGSLADRDPASS